ncbi:hypothetical protein predicted by Glimmer/Critica [Sorangium cellulosum So ce56]|uniref:Integron cassette protein VCH-CASS1 chain domain-containing protein n=1 Tax=Sorangium cellulosum (strain So ce56) TaxID=448385 RepID=A9GUG2_SORC5|nr:zinc finger CCCH domain-containing protein [Sorangium cellulosum]CAN90615.1 hypothetical protein predicted by Glimmer/Critica [Sorangium cellulosum So ce56]
MALAVTDISTLQEYIRGVMGRADHHAGGVNEIALALAGAIIWKKDDEPIKVMVQDGDTKNVLWARLGGKRYAFSYNHKAGTIEMREGSTRGAVLHSFTNATPLPMLRQIFDSL